MTTEITIKPATSDDIPRCVELGVAFHSEADLDWFAPVVPEDFQKTLETTTGAEGCIFLVAHDPDEDDIVAMIYGLILPCYFNFGVYFAHEVVMYVDIAYRSRGVGKKLLGAFENEAKKRNARPIAGAKSHMRVDAMTRMYQGRGYRELERYFVKEA